MPDWSAPESRKYRRRFVPDQASVNRIQSLAHKALPPVFGAQQESSARAAVLGDPIPVGCLNSSRETNEGKDKLVRGKSLHGRSIRRVFRLAVLKHLNLFEGDKTAAHHVVERR